VAVHKVGCRAGAGSPPLCSRGRRLSGKADIEEDPVERAKEVVEYSFKYGIYDHTCFRLLPANDPVRLGKHPDRLMSGEKVPHRERANPKNITAMQAQFGSRSGLSVSLTGSVCRKISDASRAPSLNLIIYF
jgi:hypothetical protein